MSTALGFALFVGSLAFLAGYALHCGSVAQDAQDANAELHERMGELERKLDKRTCQVIDLMVENHELHNLVNQAHGKGFIPQWMRQGREN